MHPAVKEELDMLKEQFPNKTAMTLDDYAEYFGISRRYAPEHFAKANMSRHRINHRRIGRKISIPLLDFAYWLAQQKIVDGKPLLLNIDVDMKRRRGFGQAQKHDYRSVG